MLNRCVVNGHVLMGTMQQHTGHLGASIDKGLDGNLVELSQHVQHRHGNERLRVHLKRHAELLITGFVPLCLCCPHILPVSATMSATLSATMSDTVSTAEAATVSATEAATKAATATTKAAMALRIASSARTKNAGVLLSVVVLCLQCSCDLLVL